MNHGGTGRPCFHNVYKIETCLFCYAEEFSVLCVCIEYLTNAIQ